MKRADLNAVYLRMMVYGASGVGKTRFAGSFDLDARTSRVLFLNAAGNPVSIRHQVPEPIVLDVASLRDVSETLGFLRNPKPDHPFREKYGIPSDVEFKTVVLDTLTEIQRIIVCETAGVVYEPPSESTLLDLSYTPQVEIRHWGTILGRTLNVVSFFLHLPMHVLLIAQEKESVDETQGERKSYAMFLQGQSSSIVPAFAEIVGRMTRRILIAPGRTASGEEVSIGQKLVSVLLLDAAGRYYAKNQLDIRLGREVVEPTATKILDCVEAPIS